MNEDLHTIGFVGLGNMGGGMAACLAQAGYRVLGFDNSIPAIERARSSGIEPVDDFTSLAKSAHAVISVLPDSPQVEAVMLSENGVVANLREGALVLECSTIEPAVTDRVAAAVQHAGSSFIDAAMGRSPFEAASGDLLFMVGAEASALARAQPLLDVMGNETHHCGPPGTGIRMKLVLNLLSQSTAQLSAEVVALGRKLGLERSTLLGVLGGGLGANGFITRYWPAKVLAGDTEPGFAIGLSAKDLRYAVAMADAAGVPVPTGKAAAAAVNAAAETDAALDVSGLLTVACRNADTEL